MDTLRDREGEVERIARIISAGLLWWRLTDETPASEVAGRSVSIARAIVREQPDPQAAEIARLREGIENLQRTAEEAVDHVGAANYAERQAEAHRWVRHAARRALEPEPEEGSSGGGD